ncbi:hypothetical protein [Streptomyces mirabilis]|uniref:hypothetical protein n=1 Tax=Streptomyces mirabilis TaxID=68239 RepID=UPI0036A2BB1A
MVGEDRHAKVDQLRPTIGRSPLEAVELGHRSVEADMEPLDLAGLQLFGEHGEFDTAAEPFMLVDDQDHRDAGGADLPGKLHGGCPFP